MSKKRLLRSSRHRSNAAEKRVGVRLPWTEAERQVLRDYHSKTSNMGLAELLGGRHNCNAVKQEASRLGLKKSSE